ncbi:CPBP family intramembrane metalloprotease [Kordiimonas sp. SCSIO 12603]|uniref:CPBP family intramembrane glutamic endopeptidase n=1 Tax=Kordiimonas sp. SCSIO 12603 TaxID=2829596 RepID=UPI002107B824|nr:type II CAAX endopeptidase family protein [Kordiimonas sp. SCSIO 12603]UTW57867.1 CPBP family intramembrane metalloprotease [Kordiimonas sp. SCSIO 12603]
MANTQEQTKQDNMVIIAILLVIAYPVLQIISALLLAVIAAIFQVEVTELGLISSTISLSIFTLAVFIWRERAGDYERIGFRSSQYSAQKLFMLVLGALVALLAFGYAYDTFIETDGQPETEALIIMAGGSLGSLSSIFLLMCIVVFAPVIEEIIFRGYLQTALEKKIGPFMALIISSLAFAAAHFDLDTLPILFIAGLAFGYIFQKTKSIYPAMFLHAANNGISSGILIFAPELYHERYTAFINWL